MEWLYVWRGSCFFAYSWTWATMGSSEGKGMSSREIGSGVLMYGRPLKMAPASTGTAVQPLVAVSLDVILKKS